MIIKMVWFKARAGHLDEFTSAMDAYVAELPSVQEGIIDAQWGANLNPISAGDGYTHGYMCRLVDFAALEVYRKHDIHEKLMPVLNRTCESVSGVEFDTSPAF